MQSRFFNGLPAKLAAGARVITDLARRGAGIARGPNLKRKLDSAAWSGTWPAPGATLDLDFANDRGFVRGVGSGRSMDAVTFTRASNGTFVGSDGKLAGSGGNQGAEGKNLLTFPQDFDVNNSWAKGNVAVSPNVAIAPDGTLTADIVTPTTSASSGKSLAQAIAMNGTYTFSCYCQYVSQQFIQFFTGTDTNPVVNYDLVNGTYNIPSGAATGSIAAVGGGWYRITATFTTSTAGSIAVAYASALSTARASGVLGTNTFLIWGAQLELGSTATTYYPTNINAPRFDWANTATVANKNLLSCTEQFDNGYWSKVSCSVTANSTAAPDGTNTAYTVTPSGANAIVYAAAGKSSGALDTHTFSVYLKSATGSNIDFQISINEGNGAIRASQPVTATTSWQRFSVSYTGTISNIGVFIGASNTLTTGENIYVWGAQLEAGSTATSYQAVAQPTTNTPLAAASTCNGLLIEESRTNRILWCRDGTGPSKNLFARSEELNVLWAGNQVTITPNVANDPDGNLTADRLQGTGSSWFFGQDVSLKVGSTYTISAYVKSNTGLTQNFRLYGCSNISSANLSATTSWQRFEFSFTATTLPNHGIARDSSNNTNDLLVWGFQLELGTPASSYEKTTSVGAIWIKTNVTAAKDQIGVDGVANAATKLTASADGGTCIQTIILASGSRTGSVYLKRITGTGNVQVSLDGATWSTVELSSTEWRRIVLSGTVTNPVVGIRIATSGDAVAMDYAQVEDANNALNGQMATSPILTTSATATRAVDIESASVVNSIPAMNLNAGTFYAEFAAAATAAGYAAPIQIRNQAATAYASLRWNVSNNTDRLNTTPSGSGAISGTVVPLMSMHKAAGSFTQSKIISVSSGGLPGYSNLASGIVAATNFNFGEGFAWGYLKRVVFIPNAVSESALQEMTR